MANFPKKIALFETATFRDIGSPDEVLEITWTNPDSSPGLKSFDVGTEVFFDGTATLADVPIDQYIASLSMAAILAGGALPGTKEYDEQLGINQLDENFQSIAGPFKIDTVTLVSDTSIGPDGTVYDIKVKKTSGNQNHTFRADAWTLSDYDNRASLYNVTADCVPCALHAQFGFEKGDLGASGSANRNSVIDFIKTHKFWA